MTVCNAINQKIQVCSSFIDDDNKIIIICIISHAYSPLVVNHVSRIVTMFGAVRLRPVVRDVVVKIQISQPVENVEQQEAARK